MHKRLAALAMTVVAVAATTLATAPTASADSHKGCVYPRVCFYLTQSDWDSSRPTAAYQDVTAAYQDLGPRSRGADYVHNTRNDDRAYLRYVVDGSPTLHYTCVPPNETHGFGEGITLTGIRIDTASAC